MPAVSGRAASRTGPGRTCRAAAAAPSPSGRTRPCWRRRCVPGRPSRRRTRRPRGTSVVAPRPPAPSRTPAPRVVARTTRRGRCGTARPGRGSSPSADPAAPARTVHHPRTEPSDLAGRLQRTTTFGGRSPADGRVALIGSSRPLAGDGGVARAHPLPSHERLRDGRHHQDHVEHRSRAGAPARRRGRQRLPATGDRALRRRPVGAGTGAVGPGPAGGRGRAVPVRPLHRAGRGAAQGAERPGAAERAAVPQLQPAHRSQAGDVPARAGRWRAGLHPPRPEPGREQAGAGDHGPGRAGAHVPRQPSAAAPAPDRARLPAAGRGQRPHRAGRRGLPPSARREHPGGADAQRRPAHRAAQLRGRRGGGRGRAAGAAEGFRPARRRLGRRGAAAPALGAAHLRLRPREGRAHRAGAPTRPRRPGPADGLHRRPAREDGRWPRCTS